MTVDIEAAFFEKVRKYAENSKAVDNNRLRDHFAGLAMQGLMANPDCTNNTATEISESAYVQADSMLKQRSLTNA